MERARKVGIILAIIIAVIVVDRLWVHLIHWKVIGGWIEALGRAIKG